MYSTSIDFKTCKGCGNLCPMDDFIRKNYETEYCLDCRKACPVCEDWIGVCGGGAKREAA